MKVNPKYLIYHDLIGLSAQAKTKSRSENKNFKDIGTIIDDTKNMLIAQKENLVKKYIKKDHVFRFTIFQENSTDNEYLLEVEGTQIIGRPENRLRNLNRKRWMR
ncbi:MAG: hypothetical protein EU535_09030 [Promethearchaeota archaeon]|nr:MAG: hypothetical protein EU535_09030 [Candidatus Lokiarchaeota archaeon]